MRLCLLSTRLSRSGRAGGSGYGSVIVACARREAERPRLPGVQSRVWSGPDLLFEDEVPRRDEHLSGVPAGEAQVGRIARACGKSDGLCMESPERFLVACSRRLCGDDDLP